MGALSDTMKLVVIGGTVETARRVASSSWNTFIDSFFLTAHFTQEDVPYDWIMHWLSKQTAWSRSREFDITTLQMTRGNMSDTTAGDLDDQDEDGELSHGKKQKKVTFLPTYDTTHTIYYKGHWLRITRCQRTTDWGKCQEIKISVVARSNTVIKQLVLEAKKLYEKDTEHRIHIFLADSWGSWRWNGSRPKRPLSSLVLEASVKDMIVSDCKDFLVSEDWYAERGIPYRRGYLLHGVPGSGKTSLIHVLAGELGLDIYVVSLSQKGMSDNTLAGLMGRIPARCVVLLEDLDASFTRSTNRDGKSTGVPTVKTEGESKESKDGNTLSLSGLLNAIDGVTAPEGRLLFATTNHIERLDPALSRPGRMDVWVNFKNATRWQAEGIFKRFFPCKTPSSDAAAETTDTSANDTTHVVKRKKAVSVLPLLEEEELEKLSKEFASNIPEDEVSVAALQGYLLRNKARPRECVKEVAEWVVQERETKEKIKKEKEEREKKEKEEKEKKEKEKKQEEEKKAEEAAVEAAAEARRALRKARRAAAAATVVSASSTETTTTPPAETATPATSESKNVTESENSSTETTTDDTDSESDEAEVATIKEPATKDKKEKWVSVKQPSTNDSKTEDKSATAAQPTATGEKDEEAEVEDTSAVDALVDAATTKSAVGTSST